MTILQLDDGIGTTLTLVDHHDRCERCHLISIDALRGGSAVATLTLDRAARLRDWLSGFIAEHQDVGRDGDSFKHNPGGQRA